jgi:dipeptidyl aminopeptidase/acylaminoacyl peptidase
MKIFVAVFAAFVSYCGAASAATLTPDDAYKLVSVAEPAFSPDGGKIVAVERRVDATKDKRRSDLVLTDLATKAHRTLTFEREGVASPQWSPSGDAIAFIANDAKDHGQLYVLSLAGGDARELTTTADGVQQFAWRPDGTSIAYVTSDPDPKKAAIDKHHDFFDLANDDYLTRGYSPPSHLWLVPATGGKALRLTSGAWSAATAYPPSPPASPISWSPDGSSLLFSRVPDTRDGDAYASQIVRLDVTTRKLVPLTGRSKFEGFATYSPDGKHVAYLYPRDGDPNNENDVFVTDAAGGPGRDVSRTLDRAIYRAQWLPDGKSLLVGSHDGTRTLLWRLRLDGTFDPIDAGDINPSWSFWLDTAIARDGALAFSGSGPARPAELYMLAVGGGAPVRLTDVNGVIAGRALGKVADVAWDNEGFHEDGTLVYPPHDVAGRRYPLVLVVHGGPQAASGRSFDFLGQALAARGWLVFEPNYRGSDNFGNAYERAIYMDAGAGPGRDVMAGVAAVEKLGIVDTSRIAVSGWSYGGYMTSWLMSHDHIWRTAISGAAVNNWVDMYDLGDGNYQIGFSFKGSPYVGNNMHDYVAQSPITYAAQTRCPVLVISDVGDVRVPISQSFEMYHALADNHIPVRFVGIPVDGHFPSDPVRSHDVYALWISWLADHLK